MTQQIPLTEKPAANPGATSDGGGCGCGCNHGDLPVLDARVIPGAIRHGAILGAISQVRPGAAMILHAPHDPLPLLDQVRDAFGDSVEIGYIDREADIAAGDGVRVTFTKVAP
ncbi:DUF2249 domain-containing protein [Mobilicoccus massiliensis]|uniref:DUF2249 domain-containing protein n=1 Tax=Mobilicoccus massiliensis TaxID=1522310 RepID=UPI0005911C20|nr:DUF2249 domain-containing protein [Mobilicoccus massiliensis]